MGFLDDAKKMADEQVVAAIERAGDGDTAH
jgi:hypothetical protein